MNMNNGVFPGMARDGENVNPMRVCVYDEYQPDQQPQFRAAVEAAAQFGGLLIATSNNADPFDLVKPQDTSPANVNEAVLEATLMQADPEAAEALRARKTAAAGVVSASLRSRVTSSFLCIEFGGPDMREGAGFWDS